MSLNKTTKLIAAITALIIALGSGGFGGYRIANLEETNKHQDVASGKNLYRTIDLETDFLELKAEIKELRKEVGKVHSQQMVMDAKLDILVEGYSGN